MPSGITKHNWDGRSYSGTLTIVGSLTSEDNKVQSGAGTLVVESNAVGTYNVLTNYKEYEDDALTDYFHISKLLPFLNLGGTPKITTIEVYATAIVAPDKIDSLLLRHVDLTTGTVTTDYTNTDDKTLAAPGTIPYTAVNVTLLDDCIYFLEIALDGGTTNFRINGIGITYDLV